MIIQFWNKIISFFSNPAVSFASAMAIAVAIKVAVVNYFKSRAIEKSNQGMAEDRITIDRKGRDAEQTIVENGKDIDNKRGE